MRLASDMDNTEFSGAANPDLLLHVKFYSKPVPQPFLSEQEKRPIFQDVDFIRIHTPGNQLNVIDRPVESEDKKRFPIQWARYSNSKEEGEIGTPVSQWPIITASRAEELRAVKFFTVEQIANCSDQQIQALGMDGSALREKAKRFLAISKGDADASKAEEELKKRDEVIASMAERMAELEKKLGGMTGEVTGPMIVEPRRGRPPKAA